MHRIFLSLIRCTKQVSFCYFIYKKTEKDNNEQTDANLYNYYIDYILTTVYKVNNVDLFKKTCLWTAIKWLTQIRLLEHNICIYQNISTENICFHVILTTYLLPSESVSFINTVIVQINNNFSFYNVLNAFCFIITIPFTTRLSVGIMLIIQK